MASASKDQQRIEHGTARLAIGAGSSRAALARRLLEAGEKITLVEAGGQNVNPDIDDVAQLVFSVAPGFPEQPKSMDVLAAKPISFRDPDLEAAARLFGPTMF